jgi:hypothetical protein
VHPKLVPIGEAGHHLRPIDPDDTELDMIAVMGSQERLWSIYGEAWGWPPPTMTAEEDWEDLARHAQDHESFNDVLFDRDEKACSVVCTSTLRRSPALTPRSHGG